MLVSCRIKGKFRNDEISSTNPVAVGDRVTISLTEDRGEGVIDDIHDRKNYIVRKSVNLSKQIHILAGLKWESTTTLNAGSTKVDH